MIPYLTARLCLLLHLVRSTRDGRRPGLDEPTREYDALDLAGLRGPREIHGRTAPELAAEAREARVWRRLELDLICDADFRALYGAALDETPET